jgi:hypothetical protein
VAYGNIKRAAFCGRLGIKSSFNTINYIKHTAAPLRARFKKASAPRESERPISDGIAATRQLKLQIAHLSIPIKILRYTENK